MPIPRTPLGRMTCFAALLAWGTFSPLFADDAPHIVFVTGDDEYRSEISMPMIAEILETHHGMNCSVVYAIDSDSGEKNPKFKTNIQGLDVLEEADLAVFFMRFRALPDDQFEQIMKFVRSGKPMIGLRTTTHAFLYDQSNPLAKWNDDFGRSVFGQKWITHHGHTSSTDVNIVDDQQDHPILHGVEPKFHCTSWLYHVAPLVGDCTTLLQGDSVASEKKGDQLEQFPPTQPVAWTKEYNDAKVFFTTLGHPKDFEEESMRRLIVNAVYWGLDCEVPEEANVEVEYEAPPTH
ncbi:MAG: ThuA domain-containing protein [Planctomycetota bacterium]|nr:ThuA domain-containing protein [Planctomycetota bacterium]MDA1212019.1 ThuA domain-containing protein [Planctomycetota bacterium]